ncbi:carboxypeptidase-like regulatory domain-containing protein [Zobellia galactanivorans]|uniref:carboxypeptidase-like regulatory domain-containing protein n=1 Tax=Zobellia galactanivorans (strain DSM 12802 / CCUG 47099 / CIP 106680 / NCIMB 13871 / Dsij) TaxID=63186 RepID=UPI001C070AB7|nr:carboxypeptidase-like regulatory domain-containing protein [Zobellia galactanivorans]MBU3024092.1 carboxypeptidase-like regulatory domain-containing protein [Zobellia galactanivorans]
MSVIVYSQEKIISGKVLNFENNEPLSYVNIGIKNKTVGTVSNQNGLFNLSLNDKVTKNDTVVFSFIGYRTERYLISELNDKNNIILLQPEYTELDEVVVSSKKIKLKSKKIGRTSKGLGLTHMNFYSYYEKDVDDRLSKERGMKLKIRRNCHIKDLNFKITSNDFTSLKFRVNFYKIEDGLPTELLIEKNIVFEIKDNFLGWFKVDLKPYEIYLKEDIEDVAVTIQWLESVKKDEKSKYFSISTAASPLNIAYFREKAMDTWTTGGQSLSFYLNAMCE